MIVLYIAGVWFSRYGLGLGPKPAIGKVTVASADRIEIRWDFGFRDSKQRPRHVSSRYVMEKGNRFIDEFVTFLIRGIRENNKQTDDQAQQNCCLPSVL